MPALPIQPGSGDEGLLELVPREESGQSDLPSWRLPTQPMARGPQPPPVPVPAEQYVPPTVSASEAPAAPPPIWPVAPEDVAPAAPPPIWPGSPQPAEDESTQTLAELAPFAGAAAAGLAAEHLEHAPPDASALPTRPIDSPPTPASASDSGARTSQASAAEAIAAGTAGATAAPPTQQPMKRVRVVRRIVLEDGGVVRELVAERIVPMDADSQAVAEELQAQLAHATPEEIAQLANLPADTNVVVRARVESGPLSGPLRKPEEPPAQGR